MPIFEKRRRRKTNRSKPRHRSSQRRLAIEQLEERILLANDVSGHITSDTVWDNTSEPYNLVGDLFVDAGVMLTINSGVEVNTDNSFDDIFVDGTLAATGVSFTGNETDILVRNGGRLNLLSGSSVAGDEVEYQAGSLGTISNSQFNTALLRVFSSGVTVDNNTFSATTPIETNPSLVPQFYDNTFLTQSTIDIQGTATTSAIWQVITNLSVGFAEECRNYRTVGD